MISSSRFAVATQVLLSLSLHPDKRMSSADLATSVNANPVMIRRVLGALQRAGVIATTSGKTGGAELAKDAAEITLRDVFEAVGGGEIFALSPSPPNRQGPLSYAMKSVLLPVFSSAEAALAERLACTTLASLAADVSAPLTVKTAPQRAPLAPA